MKYFDFILLAIILSLGLYGLYYFRFLIQSQIIISLFLGLAYIFWGIFHHWCQKDLHPKVVLEYIAISVLVVFILIIFLLRV
ncbi:MAG: hypothetical protein AAB506_00905 [Patescibacteria group bacterium]